MSIQTLKRDYQESLSDGVELLACPSCSVALTPQSLSCPRCGRSGQQHDEIVSFVPVSAEKDARTDGLEELALLTEQHGIRAAAEEWHDGRSDTQSVRSALFDAGRDAWRMLVTEQVTGRCLDVSAGFGRRSMLLAELADTVYAVDPNLSKLRVTAARDDFESAGDVVPVHTTVDELPFSGGAFDTIVADATATDRGLRGLLSALEPYLAEGGTILTTVDGWPRTLGLPRLAGIDGGTSPSPSVTGLRPTTPSGFETLGERFDFERTTTYALVPSASRPLYAFAVDNADAVRTLSEFVFDDRSQTGSAGRLLLSLADRCGLLKRSLPSYLVVYERDGDDRREDPHSHDVAALDGREQRSPASSTHSVGREPSPTFTRPMLISGRSRSVVLELGDDGPTAVWKVPNRRAHEPLSRRENAVLEELRSRDEPFADTLPSGVEITSSFGACRREEPVSGRSLGGQMGGDPDAFERVLRIGFDWLIEFQHACGGERITRSPEQVEESLRFAPAGLEPPTISEPVETFETPVHGDFLAQNIYVEGDSVTSVIDWEYGALSASPVVDAGFLLLDTAARAGDDFYAGVRQVLHAETEHADRARDCLEHYCDAVDIPLRTVAVSLPAVYLHRLRLDWRCDATSTYSGRMANRAHVAEFLYNQRNAALFE
ncbi:methyltransferase type 11 [Halobacteria archaeon AArc-dxtr1]|nr:methyltransferase type 11 [Halobacteria archaeon AArc-dxtr1]